MSPLLLSLFLNLLLWAAILVSQALFRGITHGFPYALGNFDKREPLTLGEHRLAIVRNNQLEALGLLIPTILLIANLELNSQALFYAAYTHIAARVLYVCVSLAGIPILRTALWAVAFSAWLYMIFPIFRAI